MHFIVASPADIAERKERRALVRWAWARLPAWHRTFVDRVMIDGEGLSKVARSLGVKKHAAEKLHDSAMRFLRRRLKSLEMP